MAENKIVDPSEPIDYRYGGETWDSLVQKLMATLPHIYKVLNALNGTGDSDFSLPVPESGAIVRTDSNGAVTASTKTASKLQTARRISLSGGAEGSAVFDGSGDVTIEVSKVTGNAAKILGKSVDGAGLSDGTMLVYRDDVGKFVLESKGTVGSGQTLMIRCGEHAIGAFNGDAPVFVDIKPFVRDCIADESHFEVDIEGSIAPAHNRKTIAPVENLNGSLGTPGKNWGNLYVGCINGRDVVDFVTVESLRALEEALREEFAQALNTLKEEILAEVHEDKEEST